MRKLLLLLLLCCVSSVGFGQDLLVAAAADLNYVLPEIASRFEQKIGKKVAITFGSSGNFYQQIRNGAPFDVFFSADEQYPAKLEQEGFGEPGTLTPYSVGKIVLVVPANSKVDISRGLGVLVDPSIRKVAIANPLHAPYGRAAVEAMKKSGIYEKVQSRLVLGENISQAAQFLQSGNADAGIIALSLVSAPSMRDRIRSVAIPDTEYAPIRQAAIVTKASKHKDVARQFMEFMRSKEIVNYLSQNGFGAISIAKQ